MDLLRYVILAIAIGVFSAFVHIGDPIISAYLMSGLVIVLSLVFLVEGYLFGKKYTIQPSEKLTQKEKNFIEKHKLVFEIIHRSIFFALVIAGYLAFVIPCARDLPAFVKKEYNILTGVVVEKVEESGKRKIIRLNDAKSENVISIIVNYDEINIGQEYTIKYLPNLLRGEVIEVKEQQKD